MPGGEHSNAAFLGQQEPAVFADCSAPACRQASRPGLFLTEQQRRFGTTTPAPERKISVDESALRPAQGRNQDSRRRWLCPAPRQLRNWSPRRPPWRHGRPGRRPALPWLRESSMCLPAARSAAACKRTTLSLPLTQQPPAPTAGLLLQRRTVVACAATVGARVHRCPSAKRGSM